MHLRLSPLLGKGLHPEPLCCGYPCRICTSMGQPRRSGKQPPGWRTLSLLDTGRCERCRAPAAVHAADAVTLVRHPGCSPMFEAATPCHLMHLGCILI